MNHVTTAGRIVVGTDTSKAAEAAVDWAAARASDLQLPLLLLIAVAPSPDRNAARSAAPAEPSPFVVKLQQAA